MGEKHIKEVVEFIVSFLIDRTGNAAFDTWSEKMKISKILKKDRENIKRIFYTVDDSDIYNLIEEFILFSAFKEPTFYSPMNLTEEQEYRLWDCFIDYIGKETSKNKFEINKSYKEKIVRCINLHNEAINNIIMDEKSRFHIKIMQKQHESIEKSLNSIINTLNTETNLQENCDKLSFIINQLESIMKSYRFDISQLRKSQLLCILGSVFVLISMAVSVPLSLKYVENIYTIYVIFMLIIAFETMLMMFWKNITEKLRILENEMETMRKKLFYFHNELYSILLERKIYKR